MSTLTTGVNSSRACHNRIRAFSTRAGRIGGLLLAIFLAALPLQAVAQTQGVSISVSPNPGGQYPSIDEGGTFEVTLRRTGDNSNALTVQYATRDGGGPEQFVGNANDGTDYTGKSGSLTFSAGNSESFKFEVETKEDTNYEPWEYFTITVSGSYQDQGEMASFTQERELRINEDDERYLTLSPVSNSALGSSNPEFMAKEGGITNGKNELTISLNATLPYPLDIPYTVGFSPHTTAATSLDFNMSSSGNKATIPMGAMSVTIDVSIIDDILVEPTEYFTLQFGTTTYDDLNGGRATYKDINFQDSKLTSQPLSVSIMDNDTAPPTGGFVYLRGEGGGGITGFPSTRKTLTEGQSTTITAEIAGAAPTSDIQIPLKVIGFPSDEVTSADYSIPTSITIPAGQKSGSVSGSVTLTITDDTDDERYRELLVVEIDEMGTNFPTEYTKGDRSRYEVVMLDNDKTGAKLQGLSPSTGALSEASGKRQATFQIEMDRLPKKDTPAGAPFSGVTVAEGDPTFKLEYSGAAKKATRNDDYMSPIDVQGNNCSTTGGKLTCTVTFTVKDDKLYEGGSGTTEKVSIRLRGADWKERDGKDSVDGIKNTGPNLSLTIEDNDKQPMLSIGDVTANEGGKLAFEVTRAGAMENKLSVRAATAVDDQDGANHAANSDYETRARTLEFAKGNMKQTFEVTTTQDVIDEMDETFLVKLSNAKDTGGEPEPGIEDDTAIGTIKDNDDAPTELTITVDTDTSTDGDQATIAEAASETTVHVTAMITSPTRFATDQTVTVTVGNADNEGEASAREGEDYETVEVFTITIPATEVSGKGTFDLTPVDDKIDDDGEKISVEGELGDMTVTQAAITIVDDDTRGITVSKATLTIDEADNTSTMDDKENQGTYKVALTSQPEGGTVTINITNEDPLVATVATVDNLTFLTFDADNWEMAQEVTMIAKDDTIDDTDDQKTTTITHTVSANGTDYEGQGAAPVKVTVRDDDESPMALTITLDTDTDTDDNQSTISEGADETTVRITATLDGETQFATAKTIAITVGDSDEDTATEGGGGDYNTVNDFDITLPAKATSVSHDLSLSLINDTVDELDEETVTVTGKLAGVTVKGTTFTIEDNDPPPTVTLVLTPASINESGATNASTVSASMDGKSSEVVTLTVSATPVSPAVAGDLTLSDNKTLAIPANTQASTGVVTITAVDNDVDAADKTVTVAATVTGGNGLVQAPGNQTLTITDDDTRGITVSKATLTLDEEDNTATMEAVEHQDTYTVVLDSEPSGGRVTIGVASDDTNIAGVAPATLTFTASNWDEPQTVTVTAALDGIDNPMDRRTAAITHTVTATGTDYDVATASGVTVTVNDDDGLPTLSINSPSVTEVDSGATSTLTFTVQLLPQSGNTVTVAYADAGSGTATFGGTDYATLAGGTLTFAPGETSKSVAVTVSGDDIDELDETVVVRLSSPSNATFTSGATTLDGTGTINDNDPTPTVSVADATTVSEGDVAAPNPPNNMMFAVTLSAASGLDVTVPYTLSGTATAGTDYTEPDPRSVTIDAGETQVNIAIPVAGDEVDEENETITVTLGEPTNATVSTAEGAGAASGTITDDDTRGVSVTPTALTVPEADNAGTAATREDQETYKVVLTSQPTGAVTVNLKSGDESVARINTASLVFDSDDWNSERTVTVTGQPDVIDNTNDIREVDISHTVSAAGTDYADETAESVAVTVTDDDAAPSGITLTANPDSVTENGGAKTITVTAAVNGATRYAEDRTVSVSVGGGTAISGTDYTAVDSFEITIGAGEDDASNTFTLTPGNDVLAEGDETIDVTGTLSGITITADEITLTDDDDAPSGITLSVDTNGAEHGTPSTLAENAGATVVTVTATVNGETRYVDAKTVAVSVADGTAASPADYAAVSSFNIIIAEGTASHTGSFTVTPVDDDLDESNETIDVTGTLSSVTITGATVTLTDNDDPVSFSIANAEATEGGKVTFTVSRKGAGDNVASVKVTTATDSGDGVEAADADDYTAIATAQTLNFAKGVTSQTVEVQTTQDDLFEPDETFKAVLSEPALGDGDPGTGVTIESGKGTATGTIKNDDTEPSFAVADASASEGDAITFTVTRSGAMDNAVSVKWNTKADSSDGANAASASDYTPVTTATTLTFAKGVGTQTFTVATTEDVLAEGTETFLVELTEAAGGTIDTAEATGTINDDDAAPSGITLTVSPATVGEGAGETVITVTASVNGTTRYVDAKTVVVSVADNTAASPADYAAVSDFSITIAAGAASHTGSFTVTPVDDDLDESNETIDVTGTLSSVTITGATVTLTDNDDPVSFSIANAEATEGGKVTFTVSRAGAEDNVVSVKIATAADSGDDVNAADADDYTAIATAQTLNFAKGVTSQTVEVQTTQDDLFEPDETFKAVLSEPALGDGDPGTGVTIESGKGTATGTIKNDDTEPSFAVADASASEGDAITFTVTRSGAMDNAVSVKWNTKADSSDGANAASASDYTPVTTATTLTFAKGVGTQTFTVATTEDVLAEGTETFLVELTEAVGGTIDTAEATGTITDDDDAPSGITLSVDTNGSTSGTPSTVAENAGATVVTVTATVNGTTRYVDAKTVAVSVVDDTAASPADYAAVSDFSITIAAGDASHTGSFTVTPVDDDLDESNETIDVTGTLSSVTITGATVTLTDNDDPVSFSIANAEATEGGKVVFTVSRAGAEDNVVSVKIATAADSGDDVNAADADDYTAIATAQTLNFAKGVTSQMVEIQTTQDDLFEPDETFKAVLSAPALGQNDPGTGVSIESGKGTATGTIKNDDTEPSFAVADASASEGDAITFTVTRSGAMDNVVSVKWNTKADSSDGANAASTSDYTVMTTATKLDFAKGVNRQTFTVATTEDVLAEGTETFLVELTEPAGGTIDTAEATGTINDDDAEPTGITLTVSPATVGERAGETEITVTATVNGTTRYVDAKTVTVSVGGGTAISDTDYDAVANFDITIAAGEASKVGTFDLTPTEDDLHEGNETINVSGTSGSLTITPATVTINDDDDAPSGITLSVDTNGSTAGTPSTVAEDAGTTVVTVTATVNGTTRYVDAKTVAVSVADGTAASPADYAAVNNFSITIAAGAASHAGSFTVTPVDDDLDESNETINVTGTLTDITITGTTVTLTDTDDPVSFSIADAEATEGGKVVFTVSREGAEDNVASVKIATAADSGDDVNAADADDYTAIATAQTLNFAKGVTSQMVEIQTTQDDLFEPDETFKAVLSAPALGQNDPGTGVSIESGKGTATGTIKNDDTQPSFAVADASASEGDAITFTVTRSGAMDNVVSVKWNTKADSSDGANAASTSDYTVMTTATKLDFAKGVSSRTFTVATTEDVLAEGTETFLVELTGAVGGAIATAEATGTITDDDAAPSGITLSVDTNGSTSGTPSTVAEDAGTTVVTVTATVNGETRYVEAKTVAVSVADGTAASPADYAAVNNFSITIAAGAASHTGSFTVTPVDDNLDESNETIDVTGTLSSVTITGATVTLTDNDDPVSFSIADAEATEGGKVVFTVSRAGAGDNVASVKIATAADSGDDVNAASTSDYTAIATAQTLNFAKGVTSQMVEIQTTQDDLFEPDETFKAVLSAPALGQNDPGTGVSIESGKGTAIGTIKNNDTQPSFAVADASASEGDAITFTVTRSGAMDNVVSVKWNTKADSSDGANAASTSDYTVMTTATKLDFAKGVSSRTFTVATTEDVLAEGTETFLVELTGAVGGAITTAEATGTVNDDDDAPSGITLTVSPATVGEGAGETEITVTATVNGTTRYVDAKTVTVSVGGGTAISDTDYDAVANFDITIAAGDASKTGTFDLTPTQDDLHEGSETINVSGTSDSLTITPATVTINDDDGQPSFAVADASANEGDAITFTVTRSGAMDNAVSVKWNTKADSSDGANAASTSDYTPEITAQTLTFAKGVSRQTFTVATTEDVLAEDDETFLVELTEPAGGTIDTAEATGTITDDDDAPSGITLTVSPATVGEGAGETEITVTATVNGTTRYVDAKTVTVSVGGGTAISDTDYDAVANFDITIAAGDASKTGTFDLTPTQDDLHEGSETINVSGTSDSLTITPATVTINDDDGQPSFAVADASANEGDAITFTVTRSGAMDNAVSVKWNTKADSSDGANAASTSDYTVMTTATKLDFAKGVNRQTFTVATTEDVLAEGTETFLVELTEPAGGTIDTAEATGTINDDDAEPTGITLTVSPATVGERAGETEITVTATVNGTTRYVDAKTVTVSVGGGTAISDTDYDAVANFDITIAAGEASKVGTFDLTPTEDDLHEGNETINVSGTSGSLTITPATVTINDDDDAPSGITLSVDTNGSTAGTPSTVAEDAGTTVVTVTATVNGTTRYVDAKTVAVSVADGTAASPADYAAVNNFSITIAAGAASHAGSFTVTPVDDDLDESNETINVTGTLSSVTITGATVTLTDNDDPVSFSIADAEATEGGKVVFTVSRAGAGDNVASVKIATAADSGDDVNAASTSDYTAIATAQTLNFAKGVTSQMVEIQTTQDDLFEPDETFKAVLSAPALGQNDPGTGVSIESGKGTAIGTIKNNDTQPSFAVADASASEGDAITFTVTRSGAMDNVVSVKWNTKADSSDGANAASTSDYTVMTTATKLDFAKGVSSRTFTVATTEDVLAEGTETFLVELTGAVGGAITTAEATGTVNDDDDAPSGITLTVSPATVGEGAGETEITVTATVNGTTRYVDAKTVTVSVGGGTAISDTDYDAVANFDITIAAGDASKTGTFDLTPTQDDLHEGSETINVSGTSDSLTITPATVTINDDDGQPSFAVADASANEGDAITFTVTRSGAMDNAVSVKWNTKADSSDGANAASTSDYTPEITAQTLTFAKGVSRQTFTVATTEDVLAEDDETFLVELTEPAGGTIDTAEATGTITDDDVMPSTLTLSVDADTGTNNVQTSLAEDGGEKTVRVTATLGGSSTFTEAKTVAVEVGADADGATEGIDYANVETKNITINAGASSGYVDFQLTPTNDDIDEPDEGISVEGTLASVTITGTSLTITDDEGTPTVTLVLTPSTINESGDTNSSTVTATLSGKSSVAVTLTVAAAAGADTASGDFTVTANKTLTIAEGATTSTGAVAITAVDNDIDAPNKTVTVSATASGGGVANPGNQTLTITDDEGTPTVTLVLTPSTINESGNGNASTVTATLSGESSAPLTITVSVPNDAPVTLSTNTTLTIAAGAKASTGAVTITAVDNDVDAPNKTVTVSATASGGGVAKPNDQTLTINDDEGVPTATLVLTPTTINESGGTNSSTVTATLSGKSNEAVTLTVAAAAGADTAAADFTVSNNKTLTIAAGATTSTGAVTITAVDNNVDAPNKTVTVSATASGGGVGDPANQTLTITDDDVTPSTLTLSVDTDTSTNNVQTTLAEDGGAKMVRVTATLGGSTFTEAKMVTLEVGADADSAEKGTDYTTVEQQSITINAGAASGYVDFKLTPTDDTLHEGSETISLEGTLADVTVTDATITLTDDDATPSGITLSVSPVTVEEGAGKTEITVTATVNGTTRYVDAKTVVVSVGGGTATSGTDYDAVSNFDIIIAAGDASKTGTFDLTPTQDDLHEGSETINVSGTSDSLTITPATVTINDDDGQPSFAVADASANEGDTITFTVTRSGAMDNAVSVKWNTKAATGAGAASTSDYTAMTTATKLDFAKGVGTQTFTVATTEDSLHEGDETFLVELTEPVDATITDAEATGTITDDDALPTALTLSVDADTDTNNVQTSLAEDGGAKMVRVTASLGGSSTFNVAKTVAVEVGADADGATEGTDYTNVGTQNITINAGASSGYVEFTLTPTDDDIDEPDEGISIEGTLASVTVTGTSLTITDDEATPTVTLVLTPATINESGETNASTVTATLSGESSAAVTVEVSVPNTAPVTLSSNTTLTIAAGSKASTGTVTITAVDNNVDAPNETVTVSAAARGGVAIPVIETLTINDDDVAPTGITLSVSPATVRETDGETEITVTATVNGTTRYADAKTVTVSVGDGTATSGMDYDAVSNFDIIIAAGDTSNTGTFDLTIINDAVQEKDETIEITGSSGALNVTKAMITITNSDPMPAAWLGRFGRTVAEQALDGIAGRIAASRSAGVQGSIAGHALNFDSPYSGSEALPRLDPRAGAGGTGVESSTANDTTTLNNLVNNNVLERSELTLTPGDSGIDAFDTDGQTSRSYTMTGRELLLGSSFTATGEKDVSGGSLASWGRTAQSSFDGREGTLSLDGEATTTMLGVDYARDHWLVGMALMQSNGKGGYQDSETELRASSPACSTTENGTEQGTCNGAVRDGEGEVEATLTAVTPYAAIQTSENLKLWGTLGHGTGEVTLTPAVGDPLKADISWTMAAVGLRSDIIVPRKNSTELGPLSDSGLALALTADALWARTSSNRTQDMVASDSDVTRLRFGLEGSYQITLKQGGSVTPRLEVGVRQDGGSAETGLGIELVGGLSWLDPTIGLSIDLSGRTLIVHSSDDLKNQSFAVAFAWDPDPATQRGPSLKFSQQWGTIALGGLDTPFGPDSIEDLGDSENTARWQADAAWGFPIFGGTFTGSPHVGVGLASDTRDYSLGWRLTPAANANAPDLSFAVKATRQESDTAPPEHSIGFVLIFRW